MTDLARPTAASRPIHRPRPDFHCLELSSQTSPVQRWLRLFSKGRESLYFNRNPGNRFTPKGGAYEVCYFADSLRTCVLELFGDELYAGNRRLSRSRWESKAVACLLVPPVRVCDLGNQEILSMIGLEKGAIYSSDLSVPQQWARAIMEHSAAFEGIAYESRFGDGRCLALFDCAVARPGIVEEEKFDLHLSREGELLLEAFQIRLI